jgi:hypothetical protein
VPEHASKKRGTCGWWTSRGAAICANAALSTLHRAAKRTSAFVSASMTADLLPLGLASSPPIQPETL